MKKIIFLLILTIVLFQLKVLSQESKEDSLLIELNKATLDTTRVNLLIELYKKTERSDTEKGFDYIQQALDLAQKIGYDWGIGMSMLFVGDIYYRKGDYQSSKDWYNKSLRIFEALNDKAKISFCYNRLGQLSTNVGDFDEALEFYQKSLKIVEDLNDKNSFAFVYLQMGNLSFYKGEYFETLNYYRLGLSLAKEAENKGVESSCLLNLGNVNANFGNYAEALRFYQEALKKMNDLNDKIGKADCTNNIGLVHSLLDDNEKALKYFKQSLILYIELDYRIGLINSYINMGQVYAQVDKYEEAEINYNKALELSIENDDKYNILIIYANIGTSKFENKDFLKAKEYFQMALDLSFELKDVHSKVSCLESLAKIQLEYNNPVEAITLCEESLKNAVDIGVKSSIRDAYKTLSDAYLMLNKEKDAFKYYKLYKVMHDSIFNEESGQQINVMETIYQTEKKQQQLELQETQLAQQDAELEKQKTLRNALFGGLGAIFIIVMLVGYAYILKRKANRKISGQKDEIEKQNGIIEKKNIHITDSINYAKRIQESVFLSGNEMKQHFQDSFLLNQPKDIVSGDFFWFTEINNKKLFTVVDCTGHGVPGALMSIIGNSLLNEIIKEKNILEPSEILYALHLGVMGVLRQGTEQSKANDGMDMVICMYDEKKKELHFSGARNFMYLKNSSDLEILDGDPFSIGEIPYHKNLEVKFNTQTVKIDGDTKLYLMTDGYMDQFGGPNLKKFNQVPFEEMLKEISHLPMPEQKEKMIQTFTEWKGTYKQIDDVMILGISIS